MTTFRSSLLALVATAETRMGTVFDRNANPDGQLSNPGQFAELATATVVRAEAAGVALADTALALDLSRRLGRAVPTLGLSLNDTSIATTRNAVDTLIPRLTETPNPRARAVRLARGRTTVTTGSYFDIGLRDHPEVTGWTRGLSPTACELCRWLHRDGFVFSADTPMYRHPGDTCIPIPTVRGT